MALNLSKHKINKLISLLNSSDESSDSDNTDENIKTNNKANKASNHDEVVKVVNLEYKPIEVEDSSECDSDVNLVKIEASVTDDDESIAEVDLNDPLNLNIEDKLNVDLLFLKQGTEETNSTTEIVKDTKIKIGKRKYIKKSMLGLDYRDDEALHEIKKSTSARGKFHCNLCRCRCITQAQLNSHMKIHESNEAEKFYCRTCDILFATKPNLRRHIQSHQLKPKRFVHNEELTNELQYETSCMPNEAKILDCKICNKTFSKILNLKNHLQSHSKSETIDVEDIKKSTYLTNLLPDGAANYCKLIDYIAAEIQAGRNEKFYSATNMVGNELRLSDSETDTDAEDDLLQEGLYMCELCEKQFCRRYKILYHQRNDHKADKFKNECDMCKMKFVSKKLLEQHIKAQCGNREKYFTCYICKMKYMWKENMRKHIELHHKSKELVQKREQCKICKKMVTRLDSHIVVHELEKNFQCEKCLMKFKRKSNLRVHMKIHDENYNEPSEMNNKSYLCRFCGSVFRRASNLTVHIRRHTGEKPFSCEFCDKGFPTTSELHTHRRIHTGEKRVKIKVEKPDHKDLLKKRNQCKISKKKVLRFDSPPVEHEVEKEIQCQECLKKFKRKSNLLVHMKTHGENYNDSSELVKSYVCRYCGRIFRRSSNLTVHIRRHTGEKPFKCEFCDKGFPSSSDLKAHQKTHRNIEGNRSK